jgi:lysophospholipase L1-like esterase
MPPVRRVLLWYVPAAVGLATALVFAAGFAAGISGKLGQPVSDDLLPKPTPLPGAAPSGTFRIVALGDSLTRGAGDAAGGYPERVAKALRAAGLTVEVENFGVDGAETRDLLGRLEDPAVASQIGGAGLVLISAGGNDLSHSLRGAIPGGSAEGSDPTGAARLRASSNLRSILSLVRKADAAVPIRLLGLYNPFPEGFDPLLAKKTLLSWNVALEEASYQVPGALVVPTADLFAERPDRLAADRFHPGPAGYDEIAARIVSTLAARAKPASTARQSTP